MHSKKRNNDTGRFILLGVALAMVVVVLVMLCARCARQNSGRTEQPAEAAQPVSYEVVAQDASGKDITGKLLIQPSVYAPEGADVSRSVLLDISWIGNRSPEFPMIITISDPSFVDQGGLIVFHFNKTQWEEVGTFLIVDHAVSFMVDSLSPFAFVPYDAYNTQPEATATPEPSATPEATATPEPSPSPSASPSPSPSPSPSDRPNYGSALPVVTPTQPPVVTDNHDETTPPPPDDDPTSPPTNQPTNPPTDPPTNPPTDPPTSPPSGGGTESESSSNTGGGTANQPTTRPSTDGNT